MNKMFKTLVASVLLFALVLTLPVHTHSDECGYNDGNCVYEQIDPLHEDSGGPLG